MFLDYIYIFYTLFQLKERINKEGKINVSVTMSWT